MHGASHTLTADNGRQFTSQCIKDFAAQCDFKHSTSSPEYPQSNGLAKRAVRSAKQPMEKSHRDGTDVFLTLLNLRMCSPVQRVMSGQTRTTLPVPSSLLEPHVREPRQIEAQLFKKRLSQMLCSDKTSHPFQLLMQGRVVRLRTPQRYCRTGMVKEVCEEPRSYHIQ